VVVTISEAARHIGLDVIGASVAVQGFGNAGSVAATLLDSMGAKVVAVSDTQGGIHVPDGLDIKAVKVWIDQHGTVVGFPGSENISNRALLELDVDVLIPAALENQTTADNADRVKARIVAEAANGPTTPDADEVLYRKGVFLIPDILCNAGGVTVSYFEWVQDLNRDQWSEEVVNSKLTAIMVRSFAEVVAMAEREEVDMRTAAYLLAVDRVAQATALRGLYP
jgi:glutamate dehydrogenase/leucine dehydrogenase